MDDAVRQYFARIGRKGGKKSKRPLSSDAARNMVKVREAKRAFAEFYSTCFWSFDPNYTITIEDVPWIAERLMTFGGRKGWEIGARLCR